MGGAKSIADLDVDSLSLENVLAATGGAAGLRGGEGVGEREALERRRREIERELCIAKDQLQQAMHTEVWAAEERGACVFFPGQSVFVVLSPILLLYGSRAGCVD